MAQQIHRISIQDSGFPLLSEQQPRTVIGATSEETYDKPAKPGLYYCHNVMPTSKGLDSVGFTQVINPVAPAVNNLSDVRVVYALNRERLYIVWATTGQAYDLEEEDIAWIKLPDTIPSTISSSFSIENVTLGTVNGVTYIWYRGVGCFVYDSSIHRFVSVTLTGLLISDILGITASSGYLIAYTSGDIAWSSTIDPTDFIPSTITGAGGGSVAGIGGAIRFCIPNSIGFLIYSDTNIVAATYTGNVQYPFKIREVDDSRGGISLDLVGYEYNVSSQFAFTKAGIQTITSQKAVIVLPEVTDFLAGKKFEDFDEINKIFELTKLTVSMKKKIKFIASRYLVISYGINSFTHALIYDVALERLGKIKITHTDCFEYVRNQMEVSRESIAFLQSDGAVKTLNFSTVDASSGIVILGKFQYTRTRLITLLGFEIENSKLDSLLSVSDLTSIDGKNISVIDGVLNYSAEDIKRFVFRATATNHSILLSGKFNLVTALLIYAIHGKR
jgi:hypothetical protein